MGLAAAIALAQSYPPPFPRDAARKVLENDRVVVWDVTWPKDHPTALHEHHYDQLSVTLAGGTVRVTRLGEAPVINRSELGSVTLTRQGTVHTEEGLSEIPQRKIMIEFKAPPSPVPQGPVREGAARVTENEHAIVWDQSWRPGQKIRNQRDAVMVFLTGGTFRITGRDGAKDTVRNAGDVVYSSGVNDEQEAVTGSPRAIIIELK